MWIIRHLATAAKIIEWLDFRKVFLLALVGVSALVLFTVYEHREQIFSSPHKLSASKFKVSTEMQDRIRVLTLNHKLISTVVVLAADLKINERDIVYRFSDDSVVNESWEKLYKERGTLQPIFTKEPAHNAQMVSVVNGEFSCVSYGTTTYQQTLPELAALTPVICQISLPPYYGEFSGYLSFSLKRAPSDIEKAEIQLEAKRLANEIFFKNIVNR